MLMAVPSPAPLQAILSDLWTRTTAAAANNTTVSTRTSSNSTSLLFCNGGSTARTNQLRSSLVACSYGQRDGLAYKEENERKVLMGNDPNPNEHRRSRGKKMVQKKGGRRNETLPGLEDDPRRLRTTHKLLRVLGGKAKRKKLLSPAGMDVRPMMEAVKGAAFDILQAAGGCHASLRAGRWLDLYSGTGSVGIEALSRGCSEVHFVEMDPWVVSHVLRPNLEWTGFLDVSVIHTIPVERFLQQAERNAGKNGTFHYISVTPPYTQVDYGILMAQISASSLI
ncbi:hypothetical protein Dimus_007591 [Dionaea muscipula]